MSRVVMPLPDTDFDPTESAVPWKALTEAGHEVVFATETGAQGRADRHMVEGLLGGLGARPDAVRCYREMEHDAAYMSPQRWSEVDPDAFDALFLGGGHASGMRPYLESEHVQAIARAFFESTRPVAAICHGVIVLARAKDDSGKSVLYGRKTTCLPAYMERTAYFLTAWKMGRYYRTYPAYVEEEVKEALGPKGTFVRGPVSLVARGTEHDDRPAFVVEDGEYLSSRWPGDAFLLGKRFAERLTALDRERGQARSDESAEAR